MSHRDSTHQKRVAEAQRKKVELRLDAACSAIKSEIIASYDPQTGRFYYPKNRGKLTEAEVLRRAQVDKNTIKKDYHRKSRNKLRKLVSWATIKCVDAPLLNQNNAKPDSALKAAIAEREDYAQRYGAIEFKLSDIQVKLVEALKKEDEYLKKIRELERRVASYLQILVSLDPALIKFPGRDQE